MPQIHLSYCGVGQRIGSKIRGSATEKLYSQMKIGIGRYVRDGNEKPNIISSSCGVRGFEPVGLLILQKSYNLMICDMDTI